MLTVASAGVVRISRRPVGAARIAGALAAPDAGRDGVGAGSAGSDGTGAGVTGPGEGGRSTVVAVVGDTGGFVLVVCAVDGAAALRDVTR
jgi:hypothetical protein